MAVENTLVVKGDVTVDLNGHTISGPASEGTAAYAHVFYVDGGNLTIDGEGEIQCSSYQSYAVFNAGPADTWTPDKSPSVGGGVGTVTINGGKFVQTSPDKAHMGYLIVNHGAEMTINGGDFSMAFDWSSLICNGFQGTPTLSPKMTINGGTFKGGRHTINNDHAGRMTITGGEFQTLPTALARRTFCVTKLIPSSLFPAVSSLAMSRTITPLPTLSRLPAVPSALMSAIICLPAIVRMLLAKSTRRNFSTTNTGPSGPVFSFLI